MCDMSLLIVCDRPCNAVELQKVMVLDERLEQAGADVDTRIPLGDARVVIGEVSNSIAVSLLGGIYGCAFTATVVGPSVGSCAEILTDVLCEKFKVDEQPF